jgi:hypothetical protein
MLYKLWICIVKYTYYEYCLTVSALSFVILVVSFKEQMICLIPVTLATQEAAWANSS